jgi:branched-chain amino acid transport system substrate-binding protein
MLAPEKLNASDPITPVVTQLVKDYRARFKAEPPGFAGNTYDALMLIEKALEKVTGTLDREKLADVFQSGIQFPGANGMSDFTATKHGGLDRDSRSMVMMQVRQGRFVPLE